MRTHSVVGLITNSSSETYSISKVKIDEILYAHLNSVLAAAGSTEKAEDVFEIIVESTDRYLKDYPDDYPEGTVLTGTYSYSGEESKGVEGAVFIKNKKTGEIDTRLSATALGIIDIQKNGEGNY